MIIPVGGGDFDMEILVLGALAAVAFIALFIFVAYPHLFASRRYRRWDRRLSFPRPAQAARPAAPGVGDSADQLRHVMGASFEKKKVMNSAEYKVFRLVEAEVLGLRNGCRVLSQTSLGEIIQSRNREAHASINSKRVDILIIDPSGYPIAAVEVQGAGHHQGTAAARDAVKKEALRRAGVQYIEVAEGYSSDEILHAVRKLFPQRWPQQPWGQSLSA